MDIRFETWNVKSPYRSGSLKTVSRELAKYKLDLVGVQDVRWEKDGAEPADNYIFFYGNGNAYHYLGTGFSVHRQIISVVKREEFLSDRMSYLILRSYWYDIIVLNVHAPTEDKCDDTRDSFYEELDHAFD
jgi:exonuclease III